MKGRFTNLLFSIVVLALLLGIVELIMRCMGYHPGDLSPAWLDFKPIDTLRVENYFYTNPQGILVADSGFWAHEHIQINEDGFRSPSFSKLDSTKTKGHVYWR